MSKRDRSAGLQRISNLKNTANFIFGKYVWRMRIMLGKPDSCQERGIPLLDKVFGKSLHFHDTIIPVDIRFIGTLLTPSLRQFLTNNKWLSCVILTEVIKWCLDTSFYHTGSHCGFLFVRCPTSFYNRPYGMLR